VAKSGDKGGDLPVTVRDFCQETLVTAAAATQPGHIGAGPGLIDEHQPRRIKQPLMGFP
jgi:hypothetical protein